uniref:Uncharacterized protein n=1 Tax=Microcebus murinus TaxID=30608 RepID=A0A8C6EKX4_MICMU
MRGSARLRTPEPSRSGRRLRRARPPLAPLLPREGQGFSEAWRENERREGVRKPRAYKSRFLVLYLTRCSNSSERQRERAGGPARVEEPSEPSRAPGERGRENRSEKRGFASGPAAPPHGPPPSPQPRNFAHSGGWALCTGTYNTRARTRLCGRGEAISPIWGYFSPALPRLL